MVERERARALTRGLLGNRSLTKLNLGGNILQRSGAVLLGQAIAKHPFIVHLGEGEERVGLSHSSRITGLLSSWIHYHGWEERSAGGHL